MLQFEGSVQVDRRLRPLRRIRMGLDPFAPAVPRSRFVGEQLLVLKHQSDIVASSAWLKHENTRSFHPKSSPTGGESAHPHCDTILFCAGIFAWRAPLGVVGFSNDESARGSRSDRRGLLACCRSSRNSYELHAPGSAFDHASLGRKLAYTGRTLMLLHNELNELFRCQNEQFAGTAIFLSVGGVPEKGD